MDIRAGLKLVRHLLERLAVGSQAIDDPNLSDKQRTNVTKDLLRDVPQLLRPMYAAIETDSNFRQWLHDLPQKASTKFRVKTGEQGSVDIEIVFHEDFRLYLGAHATVSTISRIIVLDLIEKAQDFEKWLRRDPSMAATYCCEVLLREYHQQLSESGREGMSSETVRKEILSETVRRETWINQKMREIKQTYTDERPVLNDRKCLAEMCKHFGLDFSGLTSTPDTKRNRAAISLSPSVHAAFKQMTARGNRMRELVGPGCIVSSAQQLEIQTPGDATPASGEEDGDGENKRKAVDKPLLSEPAEKKRATERLAGSSNA